MPLCRLVPAESAPRGDKLSASVTKGKKNKEGKESRSNKGQPGSRPSSQVGTFMNVPLYCCVRDSVNPAFLTK